MRRLVMIVTCIAVIGAGGAVLISSAGATVRHPVAPRPALKFPPGLLTPSRVLPLGAGKPVTPSVIQAIKPHALPARPLLAGPSACYVGLPTCSEHPCVEYVSPASSPQISVSDGAVYAPLPATPRSQCRRATPKLEAVGAPIVTVAPAGAVHSLQVPTLK